VKSFLHPDSSLLSKIVLCSNLLLDLALIGAVNGLSSHGCPLDYHKQCAMLILVRPVIERDMDPAAANVFKGDSISGIKLGPYSARRSVQARQNAADGQHHNHNHISLIALHLITPDS
jgi:hypothetical protein